VSGRLLEPTEGMARVLRFALGVSCLRDSVDKKFEACLQDNRSSDTF
jgi:hypothetical protein